MQGIIYVKPSHGPKTHFGQKSNCVILGMETYFPIESNFIPEIRPFCFENLFFQR